jgi:hypothetical protein
MKLVIEIELDNENPLSTKEDIFYTIRKEIPTIIDDRKDKILIKSVRLYRF